MLAPRVAVLNRARRTRPEAGCADSREALRGDRPGPTASQALGNTNWNTLVMKIVETVPYLPWRMGLIVCIVPRQRGQSSEPSPLADSARLDG